MLEFKIQLDRSQVEKKEIALDRGKDRLGLNPYLGTLTGATKPSSVFTSNEYIQLVGTDGNEVTCRIESERVKNNGFIELEREYQIEHSFFNRFDERFTKEDGEKFYYVHINDIFYYLNNNKTIPSGSAISGGIIIEDKASDGFVRIKQKYYIDNDHADIDGAQVLAEPKYEGDVITGVYLTNEDGSYSNETLCEGDDCHYSGSTTYLDKFTITKVSEDEIGIVSASCGRKSYFFEYKDDGEFANGEMAYFDEYYEDGERYKTYSASVVSHVNRAVIDTVTISDGLTSGIDVVDTIECNGKKFILQNQILNSNHSDKVLLELGNQVAVGSVIECTRFENEKRFLNLDDNGTFKYVIDNGIRYIVEEGICKYVIIDGKEYSYQPSNKGDDLYECNYEDVTIYFSGTTCDGEFALKRYNLDSNVTYKTITRDGVVIDGVTYDVVTEEVGDNGAYDEDGATSTPRIIIGVYIGTNTQYRLMVEDVLGSSMFLCEPIVKVGMMPGQDKYVVQSDICNDIASDYQSFNVRVVTETFGDMEWNPQKGYEYEMEEGTVVTNSMEWFNPYGNIRIIAPGDFYNIPLSLGNSIEPRVDQEEIVKKEFFDFQKNKAINEIVDMEKDIYYPVIAKWVRNSDGKYEEELDRETGQRIFEPISEIHFNLHFRTRDLENWKVIEDNESTALNEALNETCNWFVTDYEPYKSKIEQGKREDLKELLRTSDLLGFLNYNNNDVLRQKNNLQKSFLRISLYDSIDPKNQSLMATSTVWVDEGKLSKTLVTNKKTRGKSFFRCYDTQEEYEDEENISSGVGVLTEKYKLQNNYKTNVEGSKKYNIAFDDEDRLSCKFIIKDKYEDEESAEGFCHYIFKEYANQLHPKRLYMKVEYNHAGIGRAIPFILPMKWTYGDKKHKKDIVPVGPLTLSGNNAGDNASLVDYMQNKSDLEILKQGIKLSDVYEQSYIPINVIYDPLQKRYVYYPDSVYCNDVDMTDGIMEWNLFELKILDKPINTVISGATLTVNYNGKSYVWNNNNSGTELFKIKIHRTDFGLYVESTDGNGNQTTMTSFGSKIGGFGSYVKFTNEQVHNHFLKHSVISTGQRSQSLVHFVLGEPFEKSDYINPGQIQIEQNGVIALIGLEIDKMEMKDLGGSYGGSLTYKWNDTPSFADVLKQAQGDMGFGDSSPKGDSTYNNSISGTKYYYTYEFDVVETSSNARNTDNFVESIEFSSASSSWTKEYLKRGDDDKPERDSNNNLIWLPTEARKEGKNTFSVPNDPQHFGESGCMQSQTMTFVVHYKEESGIADRTYTITREAHPALPQ